jgi:hypothetical protein
MIEILLNILSEHWVNILFVLLACLMNAGMDSLKHSYATSFAKNWNEQFWNPSLSWRNKYSTKLPDALTDGWHILKMLMLGFMMIAMSYSVTPEWYYDLFLFTVYAVVWNVPFPYMYYKLRGKESQPDV